MVEWRPCVYSSRNTNRDRVLIVSYNLPSVNLGNCLTKEMNGQGIRRKKKNTLLTIYIITSHKYLEWHKLKRKFLNFNSTQIPYTVHNDVEHFVPLIYWILDSFELFWTLLNLFNSFEPYWPIWTLSDPCGPFLALLNFFGPLWSQLCPFGPCWTLLRVHCRFSKTDLHYILQLLHVSKSSKTLFLQIGLLDLILLARWLWWWEKRKERLVILKNPRTQKGCMCIKLISISIGACCWTVIKVGKKLSVFLG